MKYLGIDYGRRKVGLSISDGKIAEPLKVIRYKRSLASDAGRDIKWLVQEIQKIVEKEKIEKIIVGISENKMGEESKNFAKLLNAETFDETLTSQDAIAMSIQGGIKRKKRREMEDAYAATIMLQNYLDSLC